MPMFLQAKLDVDRHGDRYELEADAVATRVAQGGRAPAISSVPGGAHANVQRACACEESGTPCAHCAAEHDEEKSTNVQRKASSSATASAGGAAPGLDAATLQSSAGAPLHAGVRSDFESRFDRDFGAVRVHDGSADALNARAIGAQAFAHGRDIYFDAGKYEPDSTAGKHLLAHELTHVVQQGAAAPRANVTRVTDT